MEFRSPRRRAQAVVVLAVAAGVAAGLGLTLTREPARMPSPRTEALEFERLSGDGRVSIASFRGRPLVLNYFASWCVFCAAEMPHFEKVHRETKGRVAFLGVALEDDHAAARKLARDTGVTYQLAADPAGAAFAKLEGRGMPTTLFIDAEGRIVDRFTGPLNDDALRARIAKNFSV